jgi:hypothetical protein
MAEDFEIRGLTNFETATDGSAVRLVVENIKGEAVGIVMTLETVTALLMTLPTIASRAVKRASDNPQMRITYPLREFEIEASVDGYRILTIGTPDGFKVSFSLTEELSRELGEAHLQGAGQRKLTH